MAAGTQEPRTVAAPHRPQKTFGYRFVTPLLLGGALNPINSSVIATALVAIAAAMHVSVGQTSILISCLYVTCAVAQPTAGRLAEEFGPRRVFLTGIMVVLAGALVGGTASDLTTLIVARVLIGAGTSAAYPSAMLLIRRRAEDTGEHAASKGALGYLAVIGSATIAVGPTFGGLLVDGFGWRAAFLVNVPFALLTLLLVLRWVPADRALGRRSLPKVLARIDVVGVSAFAGALTAFLVALQRFEHPSVVAIGLFLLCGGGLVWWELRAANPFLDVRLLAANGVLTRTYLRHALCLVGIYSMMYGLTQWMQVSGGLSPATAGLILLPMGTCSVLAGWMAMRWHHPRRTLVGAGLLSFAASVATLFLGGGSPTLALVVVTAVVGLATGAANVTNQAVLYSASAAESLGTASGLLRTFAYIGSIASATITGLAFHGGATDHGLHVLGFALVGISAVLVLMSACDRGLVAPTDVTPRQSPKNG